VCVCARARVCNADGLDLKDASSCACVRVCVCACVRVCVCARVCNADGLDLKDEALHPSRFVRDFFEIFNIYFFLFWGGAKNSQKGRWGEVLSSTFPDVSYAVQVRHELSKVCALVHVRYKATTYRGLFMQAPSLRHILKSLCPSTCTDDLGGVTVFEIGLAL